MLLTILIVVIVVALIYGLSSRGELSLNERLYLKRRGYEPPAEFDERPPVPKDIRLLNLIESLSDISPFARQRAAEDLSRMCKSGKRDGRMLPALVTALDDSDASVRSAVAAALGNLGDPSSTEPLKSRMEVEESIHVRASLEQALAKLGD
ncbi:MAG TPA: HEAT repeat domain-containing protein [Blastocatellia bacterium]|nr:HEAT repeat domain-containing protein [Blastocatellia bacterium]